MESNTTEITTLITENLPNCTKEDPGYILMRNCQMLWMKN